MEVRDDFGGLCVANLTVLNLWRAFFLFIAGLENGREGGTEEAEGGTEETEGGTGETEGG